MRTVLTPNYWQVDRSELLKLVNEPSIKELGRVVPIGQSLVFGPTWDGFDTFNQLCRRIVLE